MMYAKQYYLYSVWGERGRDNFGAALEEIEDVGQVPHYIRSLLEDHPDALYQVIEGRDVSEEFDLKQLAE